jgi:hypothetical protein
VREVDQIIHCNLISHVQGLKSIGNTGTAFPGRQIVGRKEEAFIMMNQEDGICYALEGGKLGKYGSNMVQIWF